MKKILITGAGSFIGKNLDRYLQEYNAKAGREEYRVDRISQRDPMWETFDLSGYDVVFQASGIAHVDIKKVSREEQDNYYKVNCDLAVETAKRAQKAGVGQFIYPSSVIIYGDSAPYGHKKNITADFVPSSANFYGDSKIQAERELEAFHDEYIRSSQVQKIAPMRLLILRLPMVYGKGGKGNYNTLAGIAAKTPVFPTVQNARSMIYIDNLCECIRLAIDGKKEGVIYPQNKEYVSTARMVKQIGLARGKKIHSMGILNPLVDLTCKFHGKIGNMARKAFGNLTIDYSLSPDREEYCIYDFEESIKRTEN